MIKKLLFLNMLVVVSLRAMEQGNAGNAGMQLSCLQKNFSLSSSSELSKEILPDDIMFAMRIDCHAIDQVESISFRSICTSKLLEQTSKVQLLFEEANSLLKGSDFKVFGSYIDIYNKLLRGTSGSNGLLWSDHSNEQIKRDAVALFHKRANDLKVFAESLQGIKKRLSAEIKEGDLLPPPLPSRPPCFPDGECFQESTEEKGPELVGVLKAVDCYGVPMCDSDCDYNGEIAKQQFNALFDPFNRDKNQRNFETNIQAFLESTKLLSLEKNRKTAAEIMVDHPAKKWLLQQGEKYYKKNVVGDIKFFSNDCCFLLTDNGVYDVQTGECICYITDLLRSSRERELEKHRVRGSSGPDGSFYRDPVEKACCSGMKAFSPDGNYLVSTYSKRNYYYARPDGWTEVRDWHKEVIEVFDVRNGTACFIREKDAGGSEYNSKCRYPFSFSPDSNFLYLVESGEEYEYDFKKRSLEGISTCPIWAASTENHSTSADNNLVGKYRVVRLEDAITITNVETEKIITVYGGKLELSPDKRYILSEERIKISKSNMNVPDKKIVEESGILDVNDIIALDQILSEDLTLEQIVALISIYEKDKNNGIFQLPEELVEHFSSLPENIKKMLHAYRPE